MDHRASESVLGEWRASCAQHQRRGAELLGNGGGASVESALRTAASGTHAATFLVISVDSLAPAAVQAIVDASNTGAHLPRLCLAVSGKWLAAIDAAEFDPDHIGWMLDGVDAQTPIAQLIDERIEAIRFSREFVAAAARNMRVGCALESMLALAHELGMCTLGFDVVPAGAGVAGRHDFDYVAAPPSAQTLRPRARSRAARRETTVTR